MAKKKLLGHMTGGRTTREVQMYPGITGFNRDMAAKGKPFGKQGCSSGPSLIPGECYIIPGLAFSLGVLERCRMIPLEGSMLILALLLIQMCLSFSVPTELFGFNCSSIHAAHENVCLC